MLRISTDLANYTQELKFAAIDTAATTGDKEVVAAVTGKQIRVLVYSFTVGGDETVTWYSDAAGTALTGAMRFPAAGDGVSPVFVPTGHFQTAAGEALVLNQGVGGGCDGYVVYIEI